MKPNYFLNGRLAILMTLFFSLSGISFSQVGIGTTNPDPNAKLDITSSTAEPGGLLLPRVALIATNSPLPLTGTITNGMAVYNTATAGSGTTRVTPGFYYHDGGQWVRLASASQTSENWALTGNAGTTAGTNFLGTTDVQPLVLATQSIPRMRLLANGQIIVNAVTPYARDRFTVQGASNEYAISGYSSGDGGRGVYGYAGGGFGIMGESDGAGRGVHGANTGSGQGVIGFSSSSGTGVQGQNLGAGSTGTGVFGVVDGIGDGVVGQNTGTGNGILGLSNNASGIAIRASNSNTNGIGLIATGGGAASTRFPGVGATVTAPEFGVLSRAVNVLDGTGLVGIGNGSLTIHSLSTGSGLAGSGDTGIYGFSTTVIDGTGIIGVGNNSNSIITIGGGSGVAGTGLKYGVYGYSTTGGDGFGGAFQSNFNGEALVAGWIGSTRYKIYGQGTVSTVVKDVNEDPIIMFAPEAPEILFQDYGIGKLSNGSAVIEIDPNLSKNIRVDEKHPLKVFVQLEGDCNGVYVTAKSSEGFTVKELQNGNSNVSFSWQIVATRADEKVVDSNGEVKISVNSIRFPAGLKTLIPIKREKVFKDAGSMNDSNLQLKSFDSQELEVKKPEKRQFEQPSIDVNNTETEN